MSIATAGRLLTLAATLMVTVPARADFDMTGTWILVDPFNPPNVVEVVQAGTDLTLTFVSPTVATEVGTIDPVAGTFATPALSGTLAPDGTRFTGVGRVLVCRPFGCSTFEFPIAGQRAPTIVCGNGAVDLAEECDDANAEDGDGCDHDCTATRCGNGIVTAGEVCDDGNGFSGDGCNADCTPSRCGDGIRSAALGEFCDDGNLIDGDGCDSNCTPTVCGNAIVTSGEACDQGPGNGDACCTTGCRLVDPDADGVCTADDNCPGVADATQRDVDQDGIGDVCDPAPGQQFEVSRVSVKPAGAGSVLRLRARGLGGTMPHAVTFVTADGRLRGYLLSLEPGWSTLACSTSSRSGITRCRTAGGAVRWRSAAPSRPSKTASLDVRSAFGLGTLAPPSLPVRVFVSQGSLIHEDPVTRCDPRPDRLVCRK